MKGRGPTGRSGFLRPRGKASRQPAGVASLDYVLLLGVIFPLAAFVFWAGPRIIRLAYEMVCVLVSWPFM